MKVGIVGMGGVAQGVDYIVESEHEVHSSSYCTREDINTCDIAFVCVPTPTGEDGRRDTSAVDDVMKWLRVPLIVIRSTMPEFCRDHEWTTFADSPNIHIVYQPTFEGGIGLVVASGTKAQEVCDFWRTILGPETCYVATDRRKAEGIRAIIAEYRLTELNCFEKDLLGLMGDGVRTVLDHQGLISLAD